ncbi:toll/interleukin-1 receptor domain-containing protein [Rhodanobacter sp. MP1X3]|uniref:toll/interleukin-1 receptor domain-containing protein n=1 Tax=Rhodanobacter sp. MP1X3 TaxID=2723086 RepID=UPI001610E1B0|nr:toll/interleukin-1 receptor domain-containing protein [Rhodanobacter sp. MP1X3]MBB6242147.1 hypothetical protein [Rhodanobacter sp. MP1X3]
MARTADRDVFLNRLCNLGGKENNFVSNAKLLGELNWDEDKYKRIKAQLRQESLIVIGTGQGGSVALVSRGKAAKLKVFISYSHHDADLKDQFLKHLRPLEREQLVESWVDQQIKAGDAWDKETQKQLAAADLVLVLVSVDFINSTYCYDNELQKALDREANGSVRVIPVVMRSCLWAHSPLGQHKAVPKDGLAATSWRTLDDAFTDAATEIRRVAVAMVEER